MNYKSFKEQLLLATEAAAGSRVHVTTEKLQKNNGVQKECLVLRSENSNMSPVIYLDDLYAEARDQYIDFEEMAESLIRYCDRDMRDMEKQIESFYDYEKARTHILIRAVNRRMNEGVLRSHPYEPCLDLALLCYLGISDGIGRGTALIDQAQLERWNIKRETLFADAVENTVKQYPPCLMNLNDMLEKMGQELGEWLSEDVFDERLPMYVLTNSENSYGACVLFYPGVLKKTAEKLDNSYFILPSSIHETILLPDSGYHDPFELQQMVISVNKTQMDPKDVLSDSIYYYDRQREKILILP